MTDLQQACPSFDELTDYLTRDVSPADVARIEEHAFGCEQCTRVLEWTERVRSGIGDLVHAGEFQGFVTDAMLNQLARNGVRMRLYALEPGESVRCAVWAEDEVMVTRLRGDFAGVSAVDAELRLETGEPLVQVTDVPVRLGATELVLALSAAAVRESPSTTIRLTLRHSSGSPQSGVVAEYFFKHEGALQRGN